MASTPLTFVQTAKEIGSTIAARHADEVDQASRFPLEAVTALKERRMLGAMVPTSLGGGGASVAQMVAVCEALSQHCTATAMIFAMHQIQVASILRHCGESAWFRAYLAEVASHQRLIASVTSEVGVGGEMRTSLCALEPGPGRWTLAKDATTISYGAQPDDLLVTSRRSQKGASSDQVLTLVRKADYQLEPKGRWDTMGMRGTCSPGFKLTASLQPEQVLSVPFATIASATMVPVSHLLWAGAWLGIASAAVNKARAFVRHQARAKPGVVPPTALRLAEVVSKLHMLRAAIDHAASDYERLTAAPGGSEDELGAIPYALKINNLKVKTAEVVPEIVQQALLICGIMGYKNDSPYAMSRHLRDSLSAALMVGNDRILATNASLLLVLKDD